MFFGQNITAGGIMAEIPQQVPEGVPVTFTAPRFRVCADVVVANVAVVLTVLAFTLISWVPLNFPCRNY